jgi:NADPH:quinone reductase-like Zn-dependent oxidoreductase
VQKSDPQQNGETKIKAKPRIERNRVLVTGGAGFVGSHLCTYLVERGDHVSLQYAALLGSTYVNALFWLFFSLQGC